MNRVVKSPRLILVFSTEEVKKKFEKKWKKKTQREGQELTVLLAVSALVLNIYHHSSAVSLSLSLW
jgi:hypothetical protein